MDTTKITRTTKHRPALLPPEDPRTNHNSNTTDTDTAADDDAHEDGNTYNADGNTSPTGQEEEEHSAAAVY